MKDPRSYTLAEALLRWGDSTLVAEMTQLAKDGYDGPLIVLVPGPASTYERNVLRYRELREQLEQALLDKLRSGSPLATGYDVRAPINAEPLTIPGDRWRVLTPNYEDSSATDAGVTITGILVHEDVPATAPLASTAQLRLEIGRTTRRVRFDGTKLRLAPRSFDLLLILAEAAASTGAPVSGHDIEAGLWGVPVDKKAVNDAVGKLKSELVKQGMDEAAVRLAIENVRAKGYRLTLAPDEIHIVK